MLANILAAAFAALLGVAICFAGYRVFLVMLPIWGFFGGFWLGAAGVTALLGQGFLATVTGWVAGFVVGLIFALLSYLFYALAVVIIAGVIGGALGAALMTAIGFQPGLVVILTAIAVAVLVIIATLAFNLQKYVIILLTAIIGADLIALSGLLLFGIVDLASLQANNNLISPVVKASPLAWIALVAFFAFGLLAQVRANREFEFTRARYVEAWG